ncbi:hypothetical protein GCM10009777_15490 [Microbacterium pumilum]|uniref:VanZ-like domain-containing protein n=1 Tax=Microbacterium pumilum TaxID=344165 RepID=A0ABN2S921_9MICO
MAPSDATPSPAIAATGRHRRWIWRTLAAGYGLALILIAFWPTPVDRPARGLLWSISEAVPWLTYDVIEFGANVLLFVPLGILLALALRSRRGWVMPIALAVTVLIESGQALFLAERTASIRDVIANSLGAGIGLALVLLVTRRRMRRVDSRENAQLPG